MVSKITAERKENIVNLRLNDTVYRKLKDLSELTGYNQTQSVEFCVNITTLFVKDIENAKNEAEDDLAVKMIHFLYGEKKDSKKTTNLDLLQENRSVS
jgi:hypothetical protein